jgi:hypothetical protein
MAEQEPFDMVKWTFILVACIFFAYALTAMAAVGVCLWKPSTEAGCGNGKLAEVFTTLLASALAYAAGQKR